MTENQKIDFEKYESQFLDNLEGTLSEKEAKEFKDALENSPELSRAYQEFCCLFKAVGEFREEGKEDALSEGFSKNLQAKLSSEEDNICSNQNKTSSKGNIKMSISSKEKKKNKTPKPFMYSKKELGLGFGAACAMCLLWVGLDNLEGPFYPDSLEEDVQIAQNRPFAVVSSARQRGKSKALLSRDNLYQEGSSAKAKRMPQSLSKERSRKVKPAKRNSAIADQNFTDSFSSSGYAERIAVPFNQPSIQGESYSNIPENKLTLVKKEPLSTFSIDVDTASYSNLRRMIEQNFLPPAGAIRLEEMLNYFSYNYESPLTKDKPFNVNTQLSVAPWNMERKLLRIALKGYEINQAEREPSNLTFLIDTSGSMASANKLPLLKRSLEMLLERLDERDTISIVTYAGSVGVVLEPTPASERAKITAALSNMRSSGSTAGAAGIELAYDRALKNQKPGVNSRVILATDGDFNVGLSTEDALVKLIEEKRNKGVFLTILGFGTGNYQDSKMEKLSNHGNGNYFYIDSLLEAKKVLLKDLTGTLFAIAKDVKIQVEFNPAQVKGYRLLGYENRALAAEDFNNDKIDAGELGAGHTVTALYEIVPANSEENVLSVDPLKYQKENKAEEQKINSNIPAELSGELVTVKLRYKLPNENTSKLISKTVMVNDEKAFSKTDLDFKFQSAVSEFGMLLTDSSNKAKSTFKSALKLAKEGKGQDEHGYRAEFIRLLEKAELIKSSSIGKVNNVHFNHYDR